jgi:hypothetical protein
MDLVADVLFVTFMCLFLQAFAILDLSVDLLFFVDLFFFFAGVCHPGLVH